MEWSQDKNMQEPSSSRPKGPDSLSPVPNKSRSRPSWEDVVPITLILVLTTLAYLHTAWFQFIYDDRPLILQNHFIRSWSYLPHFFTTHAWAFDAAYGAGNYYRPLLMPWLRLNYVLFGLAPAGWHILSILAHVGTTFLVFVLAKRILKHRFAALAAAAIFGLHPVHLEAVAWVSGNSESVLALLVISSFLCFLDRRNIPQYANWRIAASLFLYGLAMLFKETALVLPILVFIAEWRRPVKESPPAEDSRGRRFRRSLVSVTPFVVLTADYLIVRLAVLKSFQHPLAHLPLAATLWTWPSLLWFYIRQLLWPAGLSGFYDIAYVMHPSVPKVLLPGAAVILAALALYGAARRSRQAMVAIAWMVLPILPVLNVQVFGDGNFAHDRYLYLPSVGFSMLIAMILQRVKTDSRDVLGMPLTQIGFILILSLVLGTATISQSMTYSNDARFYARCYATAPHNDTVKANYASILGEQGHPEEAVRLLREILSRHPDSWSANYNLGYACYQMGKLEEADHALTCAAEINPRDSRAFFYRGLTRLKLGRVEEAAGDVRKAVIISPEADNYHFALGVILHLQGNLEAALEQFRAELTLNANSPAAQQIALIERERTGRK